MSGHSLLGLAGLFGEMAAHASHMEEHLLTEVCIEIAEEARRVVGTYDYGWPQLAESTQTQRVSQGFPANEPLLRTGELRDSIEWNVSNGSGAVGSNNQKAVWNFLGTSRIPARDPVLGAALAMHAEIERHLGRSFHAWFTGRGRLPQRRLY